MTTLRSSRVALTLGPADGHPGLAPTAAVGLLVGAALAVWGLPPLELHGPLHHAGIMDPLCGLTRGIRHAMRGDPALAWSYNPASVILVAGAVAALARTAVGLLTGRWLNMGARPSAKAVAVVMAGAVAMLWVNQQLNAELLMG